MMINNSPTLTDHTKGGNTRILIKIEEGFEAEFTGDCLYLSTDNEKKAVWLEADEINKEMMRIRDELFVVMKCYHDKLVQCLGGEQLERFEADCCS